MGRRAKRGSVSGGAQVAVPAAGGGSLFPVAQVSEDTVDNVLVLNTGDHPYSPTTTAVDLNIDIEDTFQALSPDHRRVTLSR